MYYLTVLTSRGYVFALQKKRTYLMCMWSDRTDLATGIYVNTMKYNYTNINTT